MSPRLLRTLDQGIGAVVVALGISAWFQAMDAEDEAPGFDTMQLAFVSRMVFFMGCLTALLALIGLYGKRAQKAKVLQAYAILIFVVCIMQLAMGIWLYTVEVGCKLLLMVSFSRLVL